VARLTVLEPIVTNQLSVSQSMPGKPRCSLWVPWHSALSYCWRKDGSTVAGGSGASLSLTHVLGADAGKYDVVVTNAYGMTTSAVAVLTLNPAIDLAFNPQCWRGGFLVAVQADGRSCSPAASPIYADKAVRKPAALTAMAPWTPLSTPVPRWVAWRYRRAPGPGHTAGWKDHRRRYLHHAGRSKSHQPGRLNAMARLIPASTPLRRPLGR